MRRRRRCPGTLLHCWVGLVALVGLTLAGLLVRPAEEGE